MKGSNSRFIAANIVHGAYIGDEDVYVIDVFGSVRSDRMVRMLQNMVALNRG